MNFWIFQSIPDRYDLRQKLVEGKKVTWYATRYRSLMEIGDIVFFWLAGQENIRGIYGWGNIDSEPYIKPNWNSHGVDVIFKKRLSHHISVNKIKSNPSLKDLVILRAPQATNFLLSKSEAKALTDMMNSTERPQEV
ncbi:EVE domain-containing protein [Aliifodinibius sp. S!AR15-10]|uniref:EVE domain-containing protein n=1 Tax=Aliifodinibius sp. S!AR15-10 TaxID=2950437 RepID=UPI002854C8B9|nr:EVE domain-containing protein [Aliifodinibius sp. S!AR15-10]MDR8394536.1 EVE domain-containing protein [Aliifodinibius sp. S!AR15-10]